MIYLWLTVLNLFNLCGLGLVLFALPGNWLMVIATAIFAWWQRDNNVISIYTIVVILLLAIIGEIIEFFAGPGGAKKAHPVNG